MEDRIVLDDRVLGVLSRLIDLLEPAVPVMSFGPCQDAKFVSTEDIPRSACLCGILSYLISYLWFRWWRVVVGLFHNSAPRRARLKSGWADGHGGGGACRRGSAALTARCDEYVPVGA